MTTPFVSVVTRLPHARGVWPWDEAGADERPEGYGPVIESDHLPKFDRVFVHIEWMTGRDSSELWIFVIGGRFKESPATLLLAQIRERPQRDWLDKVKKLMETFRADYVASNSSDVMFTLHIMGVGPTIDEWADTEEERLRASQRMAHIHSVLREGH